MPGSPFPIMAAIAIPDAKQCLVWAGPVLAVMAAMFIINRIDHVLDYLFPHWEWEKKLGWLNFAAQRRAEAVLRWLGYFIYAILAVALLGIVWAAEGISNIGHWDDPYVLSDLALRLPVLLVSLGFWFLYLGFELVPKLRGQYEEEELQKYRAEQAELEREQEQNPPSRFKSPIRKHGVNPPIASNRMRPRR